MKNIYDRLNCHIAFDGFINSSAQISQGGIPYSFTNAIQFQNKLLQP